MHNRDDFKTYADSRRSGGPASEQKNKSGKITAAAKAFRAMTAVVVFGIPLVAGTAALLSYGIHKAYKRITGGI
ncbi:MAG: hypothetical protein H6Q53_715 [Deltaproteobacteria bacterium]|nr:hypothetical protein [Deltaproteobacteria bacterium]